MHSFCSWRQAISAHARFIKVPSNRFTFASVLYLLCVLTPLLAQAQSAHKQQLLAQAEPPEEASSTADHSTAVLLKGMSRQEVIAILGEPASEMMRGEREMLIFGDGSRVELRGGKLHRGWGITVSRYVPPNEVALREALRARSEVLTTSTPTNNTQPLNSLSEREAQQQPNSLETALAAFLLELAVSFSDPPGIARVH
jgi:hypothetical protein